MGPRLAVTAGIGILAGALAALLAWAASGSLGPGRLAEVGPSAGPVALAVGLEVLVGAGILLLGPQAKPRRKKARRAGKWWARGGPRTKTRSPTGRARGPDTAVEGRRALLRRSRPSTAGDPAAPAGWDRDGRTRRPAEPRTAPQAPERRQSVGAAQQVQGRQGSRRRRAGPCHAGREGAGRLTACSRSPFSSRARAPIFGPSSRRRLLPSSPRASSSSAPTARPKASRTPRPSASRPSSSRGGSTRRAMSGEPSSATSSPSGTPTSSC